MPLSFDLTNNVRETSPVDCTFPSAASQSTDAGDVVATAGIVVGRPPLSFPAEPLMLHYSCDMCKRPIDTCCEARHVVKIDVFQAIDDSSEGCCDGDDFDHLDDVQELLQRIDEQDLEMLENEVTRTLRFDLCDECRRSFLKNPLGMKPSKSLNFSNN